MSMARWTRRLLFSDTTTTVSRQTFCLFHTLIFFLFCAGGKFRKLPESCLPLDKAVTVACNMATNHDKTHKTHILLSASHWTGILCRVTNHCDGCQVLSNQTRVCDWQESFFFLHVHPHLFDMRLPCWRLRARFARFMIRGVELVGLDNEEQSFQNAA